MSDETGQISPTRLKNWFDRCLEIAAQVREARATLAEMKKEDRRGQIDWGRLRALAVAHDADLHDEKKKDRVETMLGKGTYASWYADIVGIGKNEQKDHPRSYSKKGPGDAQQHPAPVPATGRDRSHEPVAVENSDASAIETPPGPSHDDSCAAAEVSLPVSSAASISDDEFNTIPDFARRDPDAPHWGRFR